MNITDEMLMAYADGELDVATRAEIERAIAANSELAKQVAGNRALRIQLNNTFDSVLAEAVPARLNTAVSESIPTTAASVVDLSQRRAAKVDAPQRLWKPPFWTSIAASVVLGVVIGQWVLDEGAYAITASSSLASALSNQSASQSAANAAVQVGISYLAKSGEYCRTFAVNESNAVAGIACYNDDRWRIRFLEPAAKTADTAYRTAASAISPTIAESVDKDIDGEPLTAEQEAAVMKRGWK